MASAEGGTVAEGSADPRNLADLAHDRIRRDIMGAVFFPGDKLSLDALSERYGIGVNPVREALNRLSSSGFVEHRHQRGFFVAGMSMDSLRELVKTRIWLESKALEESLKNATEAWEERVIVAYHRLARTQLRLGESNDPDLNEVWEDRHKTFHMRLLERCGSTWLIGFCSTMMDQSVRYRNLSVNANAARRGDALPEHESLMNAVIDRDTPAALELLRTHYERTLEGLRNLPLE